MVRDRQHHAHKCRIERERERERHKKTEKETYVDTSHVEGEGVVAGEDNTQKLTRMERDRDMEMT